MNILIFVSIIKAFAHIHIYKSFSTNSVKRVYVTVHNFYAKDISMSNYLMLLTDKDEIDIFHKKAKIHCYKDCSYSIFYYTVPSELCNSCLEINFMMGFGSAKKAVVLIFCESDEFEFVCSFDIHSYFIIENRLNSWLVNISKFDGLEKFIAKKSDDDYIKVFIDEMKSINSSLFLLKTKLVRNLKILDYYEKRISEEEKSLMGFTCNDENCKISEYDKLYKNIEKTESFFNKAIALWLLLREKFCWRNIMYLFDYRNFDMDKDYYNEVKEKSSICDEYHNSSSDSFHTVPEFQDSHQTTLSEFSSIQTGNSEEDDIKQEGDPNMFSKKPRKSKSHSKTRKNTKDPSTNMSGGGNVENNYNCKDTDNSLLFISIFVVLVLLLIFYYYE